MTLIYILHSSIKQLDSVTITENDFSSTASSAPTTSSTNDTPVLSDLPSSIPSTNATFSIVD